MKWPLHNSHPITTDFHELRPIRDPKRPHGAVDIGCPVDTEIFSPERGRCLYHVLLKKRPEVTSHNLYHPSTGVWYPFSNYWFDTWGGMIIVFGDSGQMHVFTHCQYNILLALNFQDRPNIAVDETSEGVLISNIDNPRKVEQAEHIGYSGNEGLSTGPHVHYEIHPTHWIWTVHEDRPDPMKIKWDGEVPWEKT